MSEGRPKIFYGFLVEEKLVAYRDLSCGPQGSNYNAIFCGTDSENVVCPRSITTSLCPLFSATLTSIEEDYVDANDCQYHFYAIWSCGEKPFSRWLFQIDNVILQFIEIYLNDIIRIYPARPQPSFITFIININCLMLVKFCVSVIK